MTAPAPERAASDPSDEVVGTMRLPGWVHRIPVAAWLALGLAALDAWYRLTTALGFSPAPEPTFLFWVLVDVASALMPFLLLAAVLVGPATGMPRRWLLAGTGMLAAAEVVGMLRPSVSGAGLLGVQVTEPFGLVAVEPVLALLHVGGVTAIGVGLARAARRDRTTGSVGPGIALGLGLLGSALSVLATVTVLQSAAFLSDLNPAFVVAGALVGSLAPLAWSTVAAAAIAGRRPAADALWRAAGASFVLASLLIQAVLSVMAAPSIGDEPALPLLFRVWQFAALVNLFGLVALVAGLAMWPVPEAGNAGREGVDAGP